MRILKVIIFSFTVMIVPLVSALEIDEKLTMRILSVSASRKTILINRGIEDGLVVGDHAKLFLTTGVVGRALVVKVSPTRSIWSVYRLVNPQFIVSDRVLNLKIASPLKLTEDSSKALVLERRIPEGIETIKISKGEASHSSYQLQDVNADQSELMSLQDNAVEQTPTYSGRKRGKSWEVFGILNLSSYAGTTDDDEFSVNVSDSNLDFSIGLEKYFWNSTGFLQNLSFFGIFSSRTNSYSQGTSSVESTKTQTHNEFGGGSNYYFYNSPYQYGKLLGFASASFGIGTATSSIETSTATTTTSANDDLSGGSTFLTIGIGAKFFMRNQFGAMAMFDYSKLTTNFEYEEGGSTVTNLGGVRVRFGLAYRF